MRRLSAFAAAALSAGAGCTLVTDLTGLSGGPSPATSDAGAGAGAGADGGASQSVDAATDGPRVVDASGTTWCPTMHPNAKYCVDFDDGRPLAALGTVDQPVTLVPGSGVGGTSAARVDAIATDNYGNITASVPGAAQTIDLEIAFRIEVPSTTNPYVRVAELQLDNPDGHYDIALNVNNEIELSEQNNDENAASLGTADLPSSGYAVVRYTIDITRWRITAFSGDVKFADDVPLTLHPATVNPGARLIYGIDTVPGPPMALDVDDILLDPHP